MSSSVRIFFVFISYTSRDHLGKFYFISKKSFSVCSGCNFLGDFSFVFICEFYYILCTKFLYILHSILNFKLIVFIITYLPVKSKLGKLIYVFVLLIIYLKWVRIYYLIILNTSRWWPTLTKPSKFKWKVGIYVGLILVILFEIFHK